MSVAIEAIPVPIRDDGQVVDSFEIDLVAPGIVRAIGFNLEERKTVGLDGKVVLIERVLLFVQSALGGQKQRRSFMLAPTNEVLAPPAGFVAHWRATGISTTTGAVVHCFELGLDPKRQTGLS